ncbi:hypothetical protein ABPG77_002286 [Micractinium sp. CCAP 211/92]
MSGHPRADSWLLKIVNWLFGPVPGSQAHVDLFFDTVRLRNEELRKPEGQRDEARLLQLTKQKLRLEAERHQVIHRQFQAAQLNFLKPPPRECCTDCVGVRQRLAAVCRACAAWYEAASLRASQQLQMVEEGDSEPAMPLPLFELQLPEGVPEELPPSLDRCSSCQNLLDHYLAKEQEMRRVMAVSGDNPVKA